MSDAHTDIARDEKRIQAIECYLDTLFDYLTANQTIDQLIAAAEKSDAIRRGYHSGRTNFTGEKHKELVDKLAASDQEAWRLFLSRIKDQNLHQKFKAISPLCDE